ncbi:OmpH family outer membrane protein [Echinicola jeungdonensis]|uniref:OmpH family outer membrane protein n=1 Tax=Echinicola jeungdonensis TaxID=709343 RepID=A0ABV5J5J8_9BACT|nr:OmpH family outer membrane protein [Echinicola jeungdonensis]MDN3670923.1 OmpH family outer membrane protein [Echinicola jeungdonensis]
MKKLSRVLGILGISALIFTGCNQGENTTQGAAQDNNGDNGVNMSNLKIAYINTDSVIQNYDYFKEKSEEISEKGKRYESELSNRAKGFEQEVSNFQQSAQNMTMNQARAKEEELMKKERNLVSYRDNLMKELSADENQLYNEVYDKIQVYLKEYAKENDLEMILSYTRGGGVWYANEALDVTQSVIEGINENYASKENKSSGESTEKEESKEK